MKAYIISALLVAASMAGCSRKSDQEMQHWPVTVVENKLVDPFEWEKPAQHTLVIAFCVVLPDDTPVKSALGELQFTNANGDILYKGIKEYGEEVSVSKEFHCFLRFIYDDADPTLRQLRFAGGSPGVPMKGVTATFTPARVIYADGTRKIFPFSEAFQKALADKELEDSKRKQAASETTQREIKRPEEQNAKRRKEIADFNKEHPELDTSGKRRSNTVLVPWNP